MRLGEAGNSWELMRLGEAGNEAGNEAGGGWE